MLILTANIVGCSRTEDTDSGENLIGQTEADERAEEFGFTAQEYQPGMIVAAPQLDDWGGPLQDRRSHWRSIQHGGGGALFSNDKEIMGWLFGQ